MSSEIGYDQVTWHAVEKLLGIDGDVEKRLIQQGKGRAVLICTEIVWKVNLRYNGNFDLSDFQSLKNEAEVLRRLALTGYVPEVIKFIELDHMEALCLKRVDGVPLDECRMSFNQFLRLQLGVVRAIHAFSRHGIVHGDLAPHNIFIEDSGRIFFVDFGHAYDSPYLKAIFRSLFVKKIGHPGFNRPYLVTFVRLIEFCLPRSYRKAYRKFLGIGEYKKTKDIN